MIYLTLFLTFFKIGIFSFGGGYAMLPMINQEVVVKHGWVTATEFVDIIAISQSTPGPIAINSATYIGYTASPIGFLGSLLATIGVVLPSFFIMLLLCKFFFKFKDNKYMEDAFWGLRPAVVGLVASATVVVSDGAFIDIKSIIIFITILILNMKFKVGPITLTVLSGIAGFILYK